MADLIPSSPDDRHGRPADAPMTDLPSHLSRRRFGRLSLLGASVGLLGVAGCGTSNNSSTPAAGSSAGTSTSAAAAGGSPAPAATAASSAATTGTITVQVQATAEKQFAGFIKAFNVKYPGITVKTTSVSQVAKNGSNLTVITSDGAPDVAIVPTNTQVYSRMLQSNQLVPIDDVWKKADLENVYGTAVATGLKSNDKPYVISYDRVFYNVIYVNKAAFAKAGVQVPANHRVASFDDFVTLVGKIQKAGYQGLAFGPADGYQTTWQLDSFLQTSATPAEYTNYLTSWEKSVTPTAKFTGQAFVNALTQLQRMGQAKVYQDGYLGQKVPQAEALFVQGRAAMMLDGNWSSSMLKSENPGFDMDWMLLPPVNPSAETKLSLYVGDTLGIPAKSKNQDLAKLFLESVASSEGQETQIALGELPVGNNVAQAKYKSLDPLVQQLVADATKNGAVTGWTSGVPGGFGQQFTEPFAQSMLNGQTTPQQIAEKVQAQLAVTRAGK